MIELISLYTVNQNLSTTFRIINETFEYNHLYPSGVKEKILRGLLFADTLAVGDFSVDNLTMGVGYEVLNAFDRGVLAVGYGGTEDQTSDHNLVQQLVSKGIVSAHICSFDYVRSIRCSYVCYRTFASGVTEPLTSP